MGLSASADLLVQFTQQFLCSRFVRRKQQTRVKVTGTICNCFRVKKVFDNDKVVYFSPCLFNVLSEMVIKETLDVYQGGILIGGRRISNLRYADDIVLIATSSKELQHTAACLFDDSR